MQAVWYDMQGPAADVLRVGDVPEPTPGPGEVRVRLSLSGVNPGDTKKRQGREGALMPYPRVIPHSDGAGVIDSVGVGVDATRLGRRVWVWGAQSYRPFGTAAQLTVVPDSHAVDLADEVSDEVGACLGIPGITAHRAVFGDGRVAGATVLVHGVLGGVGSLAAQLALWGDAQVIATVRRGEDVVPARRSAAGCAIVSLDDPAAAAAIREHAPNGVDRIVEVDFANNVELDTVVAKNNTVIAAYASGRERPQMPFWPMLFDTITVRLLGSDDFSPSARHQAVADLTAAAGIGALSIAIASPQPLNAAAQAHEAVEAGSRERVLLEIPE